MKPGLFAKISGDPLQESSVLGLAARSWKPDVGMLLGSSLGAGTGYAAEHLMPGVLPQGAGMFAGGLTGGVAGTALGSHLEAEKYKDRAVQQGATPAEAEEIRSVATQKDLATRLVAAALGISAMTSLYGLNHAADAEHLGQTIVPNPSDTSHTLNRHLGGLLGSVPFALGSIIAPSRAEAATRAQKPEEHTHKKIVEHALRAVAV